jgi:hypothetical protein
VQVILRVQSYPNRSAFVRNIKIRSFYAPGLPWDVFQRTRKPSQNILRLTGRPPSPQTAFTVIANVPRPPVGFLRRFAGRERRNTETASRSDVQLFIAVRFRSTKIFTHVISSLPSHHGFYSRAQLAQWFIDPLSRQF